jgi:hypothetical protein
MNTAELSETLQSKGIPARAYSLVGRPKDDSWVVQKVILGWTVYFFERGQQVEPVRFRSESDACEYALSEILHAMTQVPRSVPKRK